MNNRSVVCKYFTGAMKVAIVGLLFLVAIQTLCYAQDAAAKPTGVTVDTDTLIKMLKDPKPFSKEQLDAGQKLLRKIVKESPKDDPVMVKINEARFAIMPSPKNPIGDAVRKASLQLEAAKIKNTSLDQITAHRTAEMTYGKISADAKRLSKRVLVDTTKSLRQATGLYAMPGEIITITVPDQAVDSGLSIRINNSTNNLHAARAFRRLPDGTSRNFPIDKTTIRAANAFGGTVIIERTAKPLASKLPPFHITIENAIESPLFILGETTDQQWVDGIRDMAGPYAELVSDLTHISLPSEYIRQLDSPTEVLLYWDEVVAMQDYMGGHEHLRTHPQMIHIDWTFHNWLHAGYPVMGIPGNPAKNLVNIEFMRKRGDWGWFHELGHEAQRRPDIAWPWNNCYTISSVEVTVNIFSSYVAENMVTDFRDGWAWVCSPVKVAKNASNYLNKIKSSDKPTEASIQLGFYMQLRYGFGWDTMANTIRCYVQQDQSKLPRSKQEKIDQWLIHASNTTNHNLTRFMRDVWKQPVSESAAAAVSHLPDWMIASGGIEEAATKVDTPVTVELEKELITFDGSKAKIGTVSQPENGTVKDNSDGTWTYTPKSKFAGKDTFTYTVISTTGHQFPTEMTVTVTEAK